MIEKQAVNMTRINIKKAIKYRQNEISKIESFLSLAQSYPETFNSVAERHIKGLNEDEIYNEFSTPEELIEFYQKRLEYYNEYIHSFEDILRNLSKEGINGLTYSFPKIFTSVIITSDDYCRIVLSAIRYNGTHDKDENKMNAMENELYEYEKSLANFITEDFYVDKNNVFEFMSLFEKYVRTYFNQCIKDDKEPERALNKILIIIIDRMFNFISQGFKKEEKQEQKIVDEVKVYSRSSDIERSTLKEELASLRELKEAKKEEKRKALEDLLKDNIELYNRAKTSNNYEATSITNDIDALVDLFIESSLEDQEELKSECTGYIDKLRELLNPEEITSEETLKVIYYKDSNLVPFFYKNLEEINKGEYKKIFNDLNKLYNNMTSNDNEVLGINAPFKVYEKGTNIKILYTIYKDYIIIFSVFSKKEAYSRIKLLVQSKDTRNFYDETKRIIDEGKNINEIAERDMIIEKLSTSSKVRERLGK